jgi:hypothetical protein
MFSTTVTIQSCKFLQPEPLISKRSSRSISLTKNLRYLLLYDLFCDISIAFFDISVAFFDISADFFDISSVFLDDDNVFYLFLQKQKSAQNYIPQGYFPPYEAV